MAWWLQHPGIHAWWRADPPGFDPRFTAYVDEKMTEFEVNPLVSAAVAAAFRERERLTQPAPTPGPVPQAAAAAASEPLNRPGPAPG
jgi:hypothetical protein